MEEKWLPTFSYTPPNTIREKNRKEEKRGGIVRSNCREVGKENSSFANSLLRGKRRCALPSRLSAAIMSERRKSSKREEGRISYPEKKGGKGEEKNLPHRRAAILTDAALTRLLCRQPTIVCQGGRKKRGRGVGEGTTGHSEALAPLVTLPAYLRSAISIEEKEKREREGNAVILPFGPLTRRRLGTDWLREDRKKGREKKREGGWVVSVGTESLSPFQVRRVHRFIEGKKGGREKGGKKRGEKKGQSFAVQLFL